MSERLARFLFVAACCCFPLAVWGVLSASGASASFYPAYSSLRSDEQGSLVLYESLARTGRFQVTRSFRPLPQARWRKAAIFVIGIPLRNYGPATEHLLADAEAAAKSGNRVILAFQPEQGVPAPQEEVRQRFVKRGVRWQDQNSFRVDASWRVLQGSNDHATAAERRMGSGALVLMADARSLTNVGLLKQRNSVLLVSLLGDARTVVFDEHHLGLVETGTVLGLARHYRLEGFLYGILLLGILFLWHSASVFPPRQSSTRAAIPVQDTLAGFARFLERSLPQDRLMAECQRAWEQTDRSVARRKIVQDVLQESRDVRDPLRLFQRVQGLLHGRPAKKA